MFFNLIPRATDDPWTCSSHGPVKGRLCGRCINEHATLRATAATLRVVAGWGSIVLGDGKVISTDDLLEIAAKVEPIRFADPEVCPVCEEVWCDTDCPLARVRGIDPTPLDRQGDLQSP